jgi:hypothetical protein
MENNHLNHHDSYKNHEAPADIPTPYNQPHHNPFIASANQPIPQAENPYHDPNFGQKSTPVADSIHSSNSAASIAAAVKQPTATNAGLVVLQWLTYALWGWTVLGLSALTWVVISSFISDTDSYGFMPYGIAAVLVLLPIAYICDTFYSRREPTRKTGAEMLVMIIHAVLFALFGISSLIAVVFSIVRLITDATDVSYILTSFFSSAIIAGYYGLTFLRTLNPAKFSWIKHFYKHFMLATVGVIIVLGFIGPVAKELTTRNDKLIVAELTNVNTAIQYYAGKNDKLPSNLNDITVSGDTKRLIDNKLVIYKPDTKKAKASANGSVDYTGDPNSITDLINPKNTNANLSIATTYYYQLCVDYKKETKGYKDMSQQDYYGDNTTDSDGYSDYFSTPSEHPAGETCYKLSTQP